MPKLTTMALSTAPIVFLSILPSRSVSRALSMVLICSSRTIDSVFIKSAVKDTCVGSAAFVVLPVIAATMVVGAVFIAHVVLQNEDGADTALLTATDGT